MAATVYTQDSTLTPVEQFSCRNCGGALEIYSKRAKYVSCQYCGAVSDAHSQEHEILEQLESPAQHPHYSFIRTGMTAEIDGKKWQIVSRSRWRMDYKERWEEDGETGYSNEVWHYDEWLLLSEYRTYMYLVENQDDTVFRSEEFVPTQPMMPDNRLQLGFDARGTMYPVQEIGEATMIFFEGESNYNLRLGDRVGFASHKRGHGSRSVEWRFDQHGQVAEVEFFEEVPIGRMDLLRAFENNAGVGDILQRRAKWRFLERLMYAGAVLALFMTFAALSSGGSRIYTQTIAAADLMDSSGVELPTFMLDRDPYEFKLSGSFGGGESMYVVAYILNEEQEALRALKGSFYSESGIEDGEYWSETVTSVDADVKVQDAGRYSVLMFGTVEGSATQYNQETGESRYFTDSTVTFEVRTGGMLARWWFFLCIALLVTGLVFTVIRSKVGT